MIQTEIGGGQSTQSPNRLSQRKHFFVAHVFAEHARKISVGARMRIRFQENAFWRLRSLVRAERNPGLSEFFLDVHFRDHEINRPDARSVLGHQSIAVSIGSLPRIFATSASVLPVSG